MNLSPITAICQKTKRPDIITAKRQDHDPNFGPKKHFPEEANITSLDLRFYGFLLGEKETI